MIMHLPWWRHVLTARSTVSGLRGRSLHTGEVVGSIPTAPTNKNRGFRVFFHIRIIATWQFAEERRMNMVHVNVQNPCRLFAPRSGQ